MSSPRPVALLLLCALCACSRDQAGPVDTLESFIEFMDESASDERSLEAAYGLLDARAREALARRATKAQTLSGRTFEPWEMLAQGRFRLRFAPAAAGGLRAERDGDRATVMVRDGGGELRARVPMVKEEGGWRISLAIPPVSEAGGATPPLPP